jgi:hypothetical protein
MVSADLLHLCQAPDAPNTSETRLERLKRLSELGQGALMSSAIQIIETKATLTLRAYPSRKDFASRQLLL